MTIATQINKALYAGDGVQTVFPYTFKIFAASDMVVIRRAVDGTETTLTLTTHFTVSGVGSDAGGNVTLVGTQAASPPAVGEKLLVKRVLDLVQETDWVDNDPFPAAVIENAVDRAVCIAQQQQEVLDRCLKVGETSSLSGTIDPDQIAADATLVTTLAAQVATNAASVNPGQPGGTATLDGAAFHPAAQYRAFAGATPGVAGGKGGVPAPAAGDDQKFLRGDGIWAYAGQSWTPIPAAITRISDSSFSVTDNAANQAIFAKGRPLSFQQNSGTTLMYALVSNYVSGTVTIAGAPYTNTIGADSGRLMSYGDFSRVIAWPGSDSGTINGMFASAANSQMLADYLLQSARWQLGKARMVRFSIKATSADSGAAQSRVNIKLADNAVATTNSNAGLAVSAAGWVDTVVDISTVNYGVNFGDALELAVDANGTNKDAKNLSYQAIFILE